MTIAPHINDLHIQSTRLFPEVHFSDKGNLKIKGRIISDHLHEFFMPLFDWVEQCSCAEIRMDIDLDYLNSNGMYLLIELLKRIENRSDINTIIVIWFYEEEDEEHYELGEIIREKLTRTEFKYMSYV